MNNSQQKSHPFRWIITTITAMLAAGGSIVAVLNYLEQHFIWPFNPNTHASINLPSRSLATPTSGQPPDAVPLPSDAWFVYLTTEQNADRRAVTLKEAQRIAREFERRGLNLPVRVYASQDDSLYAVGVGDPLPQDEAQDLLNRLYKRGYKQVARNPAAGWKLVQ